MPWVLIADNDAEISAQLGDALTDLGYAVTTAADGAEVIRVLDSAADMPAVVVLDLLLSGVSGADVIRAMRSLARTRHIPIIVLSGASLYDDQLAGLDVDAVFVKPVAAHALFAAVARACKGTRR
jgi:DNA-binding response OmpR family regulator